MLLLLFGHPIMSVCDPQIHVHCISDAVQLSHPLISSSPSLLNLPQHQGLFCESSLCIRWPKYWRFSISPSSEYSGLISIKIDSLDPLAIEGAFRSFLQQHCSKASIILHSAFFTVQISKPYVITGKTIALTVWMFVGRVMSLLFNTLSRFCITFLPKAIGSWFHGYSHHLPWCWSPRKGNLSLLPHFRLLFSMQ